MKMVERCMAKWLNNNLAIKPFNHTALHYLIFSTHKFRNWILHPSACKAMAPLVSEQLVAVF
jgi:hypothetical protein